MKNAKRRALSGALVLIAVPLAACGGSSSSEGGKDIEFTLTDAGCTPEQTEVAAGPVNFQITNGGTSKVTEMELKAHSGLILGESENVVEGVPGKFSLNLQPGDYIINCPNGDTEDQGTLTATGEATGAPTGASGALLDKAAKGYRAYIEDETGKLETEVDAFAAALQTGDVEKAKDLFGAARLHYEAIEPVAESFGDLDPRIDARINDVANVKDWTGFHPIERMLWEQNTTKGTEALAKQLKQDVETLSRKVKTIQLQPAQIGNGAVELLNEVANSKITGEEDRYSHTDLSDFQGNLSGSEKAFELLEPALKETGNEDLAADISDRFAAVQRTLDTYKRDTPLGFALYGELTQEDRRTFATEIDDLTEPLSLVAAKVSGA
jgi:iron uptake system component EfeO